MKTLLLVGAIFFMCIAHGIRVIRWRLFIEIYEKPNDGNLFRALSVGYLLNYILPLKAGDLARVFISGNKMKNGKALGLSTVIVDRYLDIICVGLVFIILTLTSSSSVLRQSAVFYIAASAVMFGAAVILYLLKSFVKKIVVSFAKIFNNTIESGILRFAWALIWNFKDIFLKINKAKLFLTTIGMWSLYALSYYFFAEFLTSIGTHTTMSEVFTVLFAQNGVSSSTVNTIMFWSSNAVSENTVYTVIYMIVPVIIILLVSYFPEFKNSADENVDDGYLSLLPHLNSKERLDFLENYFSDKNREYLENYLKINQDVSIIRDFSAGSNATTLLCIDGNRTFFRKYAFGDDGKKLYEQQKWIENNSNILPLPEIIKHDNTDEYCFYDMPYNSHAVGLFEYAHSMPMDKVWLIVRQALNKLENSIYKMNVRKADKDTIHKYIELKVENNLYRIKRFKRISALQQYETVFINGVEYKNLNYYEKYLKKEYLEQIFKNDTYSVIHGDMTIENIICTRGDDGRDGFYIIDPNTGNVHDSPNLDYGKLLQSIHGGYEFLMSTKSVSVKENHIDFLFTRSSAYIELHKLLEEYMQRNFSYERIRSIYFHEIIHWLRLMPYKIEKDGKRALLFYAGMLMVMNDVINTYGGYTEDD